MPRPPLPVIRDAAHRLRGAPMGWYAVAFSDELPPKAVLRRRIADRELVVFRTAKGEASVLDAYCPHLGAHLGEGGSVVGEELRCPFHHFGFDATGRCRSTPYGGAVPKLETPAWTVRERHGAVLVWYGPTRAPAWELAPIEAEHEGRAWGAPVGRLFRIRTHPQEIIENTVDIGHFAAVHAYRAIEVVEPMSAAGPHLRMSYVVTRARGLFGRYDPVPFRMRLAILASGIGYSRVQVSPPGVPLYLRTVVMPTPVGDEHVEARVITQAALFPEVPASDADALRARPLRIAADLLARVGAGEMARDFEPDMRIWENKRFHERPGLAQGDGPIGAYRRWARQFYFTEGASSVVPGRSSADMTETCS